MRVLISNRVGRQDAFTSPAPSQRIVEVADDFDLVKLAKSARRFNEVASVNVLGDGDVIVFGPRDGRDFVETCCASKILS